LQEGVAAHAGALSHALHDVCLNQFLMLCPDALLLQAMVTRQTTQQQLSWP
jgi:hypothetical protein